jgi:hypothetical protein
MANPTTNYGFVLPTSTDLVTDLPADFDVALQGVDTRLKALQPGTTLGDLAYSSATANTNTRLAVGTSGQVLAVSGGVPAWTTLASAGGMTLLSTTTLSGATTTISSINQTYVNLQVVFSGITITTAGNTISIYVNGTQNQTLGIGQRGVDLTNSIQSTVTNIPVPLNSTLGTVADNCFVLNLYNYNSTTRPKPFQMAGFAENNSVQSVFGHLEGAIRTNSAISSITFDSSGGTSFTAGTVLIYGVK